MRIQATLTISAMAFLVAGCPGSDADPKDPVCVGLCETDTPDPDDEHTDETDTETVIETDETDTVPVETDETDETDTVPIETDETDETDETVPPDETAHTDTVPVETDETDEEPTFLEIGDLAPGDLVITEFFVDSLECTNTTAQYVEILNRASLPVRLNGLRVVWNASTYTVNTTAEVAPGDFAVGLRQSGARCAYNFLGDFNYPSGLDMRNTGGVLRLRNAAGLSIDEVDSTGWTFTPGYALHLKSAFEDPTGNDLEDSWCEAPDTLSARGQDHGSPGVTGASCATIVPPGGDTSEDSDTTGDTDDTDTAVDTDETDDTTPADDTDPGGDGILDVDELRPGNLLISEVMVNGSDCSANRPERRQFVEVYNNTPFPIRADGLTLSIDGQTSTASFFTKYTANDLIPSGGYGILMRKTAQNWCYTVSTPQFEYFPANATTVGLIRISTSQAGLIDEVNMTGWTHPPDGSLQFDPTEPRTTVANDVESAWCVGASVAPGGVNDKATPGQANNCLFVETGFPDPDPSDGLDADELRSGDLMIVEVMVDPTDGADARGEYVEVYNNTPYEIRPSGLMLAYNGVDYEIAVISGESDTIPSRDRGIVRRRSTQAYLYQPPPQFDAPLPDIALGAFRLHNQYDTVDAVDMSSWTLAPGASYQLDPTVRLLSESVNDDETSWCAAVLPIDGGRADLGTPGIVNQCQLRDTVDTDALGGDTDHTDLPPVDTDTGLDFPVEASEIRAGWLIITELMIDPDENGCTTTQAQYIEVYNASPYDIYPNGLRIDVGTAVNQLVTRTGDAVVHPGEFVVMVRDNPSHCYRGNYYDFKVPRNVNLGAVPVRLHNDRRTIDEVDLTGWTIPSGKSLALQPGLEQDGIVIANDDESSWCPSGVLIPNAQVDMGSPGATNVCEGDIRETGEQIDARPSSELAVGDVFMTEVMDDPNCDAGRAEFVEVFNNTDDYWDLGGLTIEYENSTTVGGPVVATITGPAIIGPRDYLAITRTAVAECYPVDYRIVGVAWNLQTTGNLITLRNPGRVGGSLMLDRVDTRLFGPTEGQSLQLNTRYFDPILNDSPGLWCLTPKQPGFQHGSGSGADYSTASEPNFECLVNLCDSGDTSCVDTFAIPDIDTGEAKLDTGLPITEVNPGDLVITEVMVQPVGCEVESTGEFIELFNTTDHNINVDGLQVIDEDGLAAVQLRGIVRAGEYAVGRNVRDSFDACYTTPEDFYYDGATMDNNGDRLTLLRPDGQTIDEVDFNRFDPVPGYTWQLKVNQIDAAANDIQANWCRAADSAVLQRGNHGTPGGPAICAPTTGEDLSPGVRSVSELQPGDLVITELLVDPASEGCSDDRGEYFEFYNASRETVDLWGVVFQDRFTANKYTVFDHVRVLPGAWTLASVPEPNCALFTADLTYTGVSLDNTGDLVKIIAHGVDIDVVDYRRWGRATPGRALMLDPQHLTAGANDDFGNWCDGRRFIRGTTDRGTPGTPNPGCPQFGPIGDTGGAAVDTDILPAGDDTDGYISVGQPGPVDSLHAGDLVITELMISPRACAATDGQYIEFWNSREEEINVGGMRIAVGAQTFTVPGTQRVGPRRSAVARLVGPGSSCYGFVPDFSYTGLLIGPAVNVELRNAAGVIDAVNTTTLPTGTGASVILDPDLRDPIANDQGDAWCLSRSAIPGGGGDRGTPGELNDDCFNEETGLVIETGRVPDDGDTAVDTYAVGEGSETIEVGDLIITELMIDPQDCDDRSAEYVEVFNRSGRLLNLDGLIVSNGDYSYTFDRSDGRFSIADRETLVLRRASATNCYTFPAPNEYTAMLLGDTDVFYIAVEDRVIDAVHYSDWETTPGRAWMLDSGRYDEAIPRGTDDVPGGPLNRTYVHDSESDWCPAWIRIPDARSDRGTPGVENPACAGSPVYPPGYLIHVDELEAGDLTVTEIMADPLDGCLNDLAGQWFEVVSNRSEPVLLDGLRVTTTAGTAEVSTSFVLLPGEVGVGRRQSVRPCYTGMPSDFRFGVAINAAGDRFEIATRHTAIDVVDFRGWTLVPGASLTLDEAATDPIANDDVANWCPAADNFVPSSDDRGSPGEMNGECSDAPVDVAQTLAELAAGDLVITEVLLNNQDCAFSNQYVEVYNNTNRPVDLAGLRIRNDVGASTMNSHVTIGSHEFALLANDIVGACLNIQPDLRYTLTFGGTEDVVILEYGPAFGSVEFDRVSTRGWAPHHSNARQLMPGMYDATLNDNEANWCEAQIPIPTNLTAGTPGAENDCGAPGVDTDTGGDTAVGPEPVSSLTADVLHYGNVAPGVFMYGKMERKIYTTDFTTGVQDYSCGYSWDYTATANLIAQARPSCPSCEFAFHLEYTNRVDLRPFVTNPPQASVCGNYFNGVGGGVAVVQPPLNVAYSPIYGAMLYESGGLWNIYTYEVTREPGFVRFTRTIFEQYYY
ncbi:MAG TPA: lamin tail domain-containing protein [Myxococcota bacterium]|nr:lamin tail domain-containing protein [Myxococcota bacterium]